MKNEFQKVMGNFTGTSMVVGIMVGTGIFLAIDGVAQNIASPFWLLLAWLVGGILATTGAITMAQLSSLCPQAGGLYLYIRQAFGDAMAFFYGCISFLVLQCGSIAAVAVGLSYYFGKIFPYCEASNALFSYGNWDFTTGQLVSIGVIVLLSYINYIGATIGNIVQFLFTSITVVAICTFLVITLSIERPIAFSFAVDAPPSFSKFVLALVPVLWAFSGWHNLNFAAEEVKNTKTITFSLLCALFIVTTIYILMNYVYVTTLPLREIVQEKEIAYTVMYKLFPQGAVVISVAVVVAALGTLNGLIFASPRAYFAMARDGLFPFFSASLHEKYATPHRFIVAQCIWSCALILAGQGSYKTLFTYVMFSGFLFMSSAGIAVIIIQRKSVKKASLYWAYPLVPIIFTLHSVAMAANTCYYSPRESITGVMFVLLCVPFYWKVKAR